MEDPKTTPVGGEGQLPEKGAGSEPVKGAEEGKPEGEGKAPDEKSTFSKEELAAAVEAERKRYSGLDSKYSKEKQTWEEQQRELESARDAALGQIEEARLASFLTQVETDGGDVDAARKIVERERGIQAKEKQLKSLEGWVKQQQLILNEAAKGKQAQDLVKEYALEEAQLDELLKAETPIEMENKALKFHLEKSKAARREPEKLDSGKQVKGGKDIGKLPPSEALGFLMSQGG